MSKYCIQSLTIFGLIIFLFSACSADKRSFPDVSHIEVPLKIHRFEQALFQLDTTDFSLALNQLHETHPEFTEIFTNNIFEAGSVGEMSEEQIDYLRGFVTSPVYRSVYDTTQLLYPNLENVKKELHRALQFFKYYFPALPAPTKLTTFVAAFNYSAIIYGENELAASLDMFLGPGFNYQRYNPGATIFSNYLVRSYTPEHLTASLMTVLIDDIIGQQKGSRLIDIIIHEGKKLYILDQLMPTTADTVKFKVSESQWNWLQENEENLWSYLLTEDLLYNNNRQDIRKLVDPSPSGAPALPKESPGQAANYIGFNIIKAFMLRQKDLPLNELLHYIDAQEIMDLSKYKPARN